MPLYRYEAFDRQGKKISATMEAASSDSAKELIRGKSLMPTKIVLVEEHVSGFTLTSLFEKPIDHKSKILFTKQLGVLLKSGVPLLQAVDLMVNQFDGRMRRVLISIKDGLKAGENFASCLGKYPKVFSNIYVQLVKAGEASGKLENILERLVDYLEKAEQTKKRVKKAMTYPIFMISFSLVVVGALLTFVVPSIVSAFTQTGKALPGPTQFLIGLSEFFSENFVFLIGFIVTTVFGFMYWKSSRSGRVAFDKLKLRLPVVSYFSRTKAVVQFCKTLGMLLDSGVNLAEALDIVTNIIDNTVLTRTLKGARDKIIKEGKIAQYLKETAIFPNIASYMISTGEQSGQLAAMLLSVGKDYDIELSDKTDSFVAKINPIMMFVVGGLIFFIVISMFMPMIQMGEALGL